MLENGPEPLGPALTPLLLVVGSAAVMATSGLVALLAGGRPRAADRLGVGTLAGGAAIGLTGVALWFRQGVPLTLAREWFPWGRLSLSLDGLGAVFLLPLLVIPALAGVYGAGYWSQSEHAGTAGRVRVFLGLLAAALAVLPVAGDGVLFLMAFEVMTLSAFFLVTTEDDRSDVREAGWIYFAASHFSLMFLFGAFAVYRAATGTFELTASAASGMSVGASNAVFALALVGFGLKAGVMPLHVWLPGAHACAPSHVSAIMSGVVIKVGIYGLMRVTAILPDPPMFWGALLLVLGGVSGVLGVAYALGQHDLKRLLAYHSIENIGIIVMGLGVALLGRWGHRPELVALGLACAVMHVWNHGLFKSLLFLSAGSVIHAVGTREIDRMGALGRSMPWSAGLFILGAVAICGLPPLNGFVSEFFLYLGAVRSLADGAPGLASAAAPILALIGALACACFIKVIGSVFLGHPRSEAVLHAHECGWFMRGPMLALAGACVVLGLAPVLAAPILDTAAAAWVGGRGAAPVALSSVVPFGALAAVLVGVVATLALLGAVGVGRALVRRSPRAGTWDCGYAAPTARMQYTASSVARTLVRLFAFVLHPTEHEPAAPSVFPAPSAYAGHVDDAVLQRVVEPFCRRVAEWFVRLRQRQSGRIQAYIMYVVLTMLGLLLFVVPVLELLKRLVTR
jgi:hydrogenase-4 component B